MKENMMSEEAFNELVNGFEYVATLTKYGRENMKYHIQRLQQENKKYKNQQKEFIEYLEDYDKCFCGEEILSKYKEIIGNDINVGSKGGKDER